MPPSSQVIFATFLLLPTVPCLASDTPNLPSAEQATKKKSSMQSEAIAITKLIEQLGSSKTTEQDEATKALEAIGLPALEQLRKVAKDENVDVAGRAARLVATIEKSMDQLVEDYRGYGLPFPPKDAKLVKYESGGRYIVIDKLMPPTYFLGFLLQPPTNDKPALLLVGTQEFRLEKNTPFFVVEPNPELVKDIEIGIIGLNSGLAVALQCKARGWNDLAERLWTACLEKSCGHPRGIFYQPANLPSRTALAYLAWAHCGYEIVKSDTDRAVIAKRAKALFAAEPQLNTERNQALLESLEAAMVPSTAKPGTVERLIDDLTEMTASRPGGGTFERYFVDYMVGKLDPRYSRLLHMGFASVPALINHLDDDRLTRSVQQAFASFPTWNLRVEHVVSDLLQQVAGEEVGKNWLQRQRGEAVEKADAQAWWAKAQKEGEEAYFLRHVLQGEAENWPNVFFFGHYWREVSSELAEVVPEGSGRAPGFCKLTVRGRDQ
jgi:hypothetical protein